MVKLGFVFWENCLWAH